MKLIKFITEEIEKGSAKGLLMVSIIIIFLMLTMLQFLTNYAGKNERICRFVGKIWLDERFKPEITNPIFGCFTYRELAELDRL